MKSTSVTRILFACQTRTNQISDFVQKLMFQKMSQPVTAALIAIRIFTNSMEIVLMLWEHVFTHLFSPGIQGPKPDRTRTENFFQNPRPTRSRNGNGIRVVGKGSWKEREVGGLKRSWKGQTKVGKFLLKLESFAAVGKFCFQLH